MTTTLAELEAASYAKTPNGPTVRTRIGNNALHDADSDNTVVDAAEDRRESTTATTAEATIVNSTTLWRWLYFVFADAPSISQHTVALLLSVVSIWCVHSTFDALLGADAMFYGRIPVSWCFDTAHLTVFVRYAIKLARQP